MEFYLVKDLVEVRSRSTEDVEQDMLEFRPMTPDMLMIKTVDQSGPGRDFAGKMRDVVKSEEPTYIFVFEKSATLLVGVLGEPTCPYRDLLQEMFGKENFNIKINISVCHLATEDTPVSPQALSTFNTDMWLLIDKKSLYAFRSDDKGVIEGIQKSWDHEDGFIYSKLTIVVTVNEDGVKLFKEKAGRHLDELEEMNRERLETEFCSDLEIRCRDGKLVKCHRAMLGCRSAVFKAMFQEDGGKEATTGILEMEEMSEASVKALLGWIYWNDEEKALLDSDLAVELLVAGDRYNVGGLVERMKEIILDRRGYEEEWFTEESALNLLEWAEKLEGMKELKDKAEQIIKFFGIEVIENGAKELSLDN